MYTLVIGRAYPAQDTGMMGIFEFEQAVALNKHGMNTVYAFCDTRSIKRLRKLNYKTFTEKEVPVYGYHFPIGGTPRRIFNILKLNKYKKLLDTIVENHGKPSYIHVHFPLLTLTEDIFSLLKKYEVPIIVTEHWTKVQQKSVEDFRVDLLKKVIKESHAFICVSELLKKSVMELTNTDKEIKVIPNMLNENFYYEKDIKNSNNFNIIAIGRIVDIKRFVFTVEAFAKTFNRKKHVKLHIVGDGPLFKKVQKKVHELNIEEQVILHGFLARNKTANLLRKSDLFVSASIMETFGVPFIEAWACGKPIIGVEGSPIEPYTTNNNGLLFEPDNKEELSKALKYMYINRSNFNEELIANEANKLFSEKAVVDQILRVYS